MSLIEIVKCEIELRINKLELFIEECKTSKDNFEINMIEFLMVRKNELESLLKFIKIQEQNE